VRQEIILLALVEMMNLVDEKNGRFSGALELLGFVNDFLRSLTPEVTAEKLTDTAFADSAMSRASVVLPVPGGPQKINDRSFPEPSMPLRSFPGPSRCSWPTNSSRLAGRIFSASGWEAFRGFAGGDPNKSMRFMLTQLASNVTAATELLSLIGPRCYAGAISK
jgi:hypothetical protein